MTAGTVDHVAPDADVTLIIPTLNEAEPLGCLLREVPRPPVRRIIVADGGSIDETVGVARQGGADVLAVGRGYGRACLAAAEAAGRGDILVFMDGDGADDPAAIPSLLQPIVADTHDFVIASRVRGRPEPGSLLWHQTLAGRVLGSAMRLLYGVRYSDMCAFRAIRRQTLLNLGMRELTYGWNLEMQMNCARAGLRILEVPVDNRRRRGGTSKVSGSLSGSLKAAYRISTTFLRLAAAKRGGNTAVGS